MKAYTTDRGFVRVDHKKYQNTPNENTRIVQESSAIGDYDDSFSVPGSSFLWIGQDHHLNRKEVKELIGRMQYWLDNKHLQHEGESEE